MVCMLKIFKQIAQDGRTIVCVQVSMVKSQGSQKRAQGLANNSSMSSMQSFIHSQEFVHPHQAKK